jgi:hypothetical protein
VLLPNPEIEASSLGMKKDSVGRKKSPESGGEESPDSLDSTDF